VLRAGDVVTEVGALFPDQSVPCVPLLCRGFEPGDHRWDDDWLNREGVDLLPSGRNEGGGLRFCACSDDSDDVL
jgi:hypothetical protein